MKDAQTGDPIPYATLLIAGTTHGTTTDINGRAKLDCERNSTIIVSCLGYLTLDFKLGNALNAAIFLEPDEQEDDEELGNNEEEEGEN